MCPPVHTKTLKFGNACPEVTYLSAPFLYEHSLSEIPLQKKMYLRFLPHFFTALQKPTVQLVARFASVNIVCSYFAFLYCKVALQILFLYFVYNFAFSTPYNGVLLRAM